MNYRAILLAVSRSHSEPRVGQPVHSSHGLDGVEPDPVSTAGRLAEQQENGQPAQASHEAKAQVLLKRSAVRKQNEGSCSEPECSQAGHWRQ